jgi:hypothetical protein
MSNIPNDNDSNISPTSIHHSFQQAQIISTSPCTNFDLSNDNIINQQFDCSSLLPGANSNGDLNRGSNSTPSPQIKPRLTSYTHPNSIRIERNSNTKRLFSDLESDTIVAGVLEYGKDHHDKFQWVKILNDSKYSETFKVRNLTPSNIKDRYRTIQKQVLKKNKSIEKIHK